MSRALGRPRLHLRVLRSTNDRARELALAGAPHGTVVSAEQQTAGRGRQGRSWLAPPGSSLLVSVLLRKPPSLVSLAAGVAVCDAIADTGAAIKWPNDIVVPATLAKLGGILVEGRPQEDWAVVGIGLNVALNANELPPELRGRAASLGLARSQIEPLLGLVLDALARRLSDPAEAVLDAWRELDVLDGREVYWQDDRGVAEGVDEQGRLLVRSYDGSRTALGAGEVHLTSVG